jgi:hypothetical protein
MSPSRRGAGVGWAGPSGAVARAMKHKQKNSLPFFSPFSLKLAAALLHPAAATLDLISKLDQVRVFRSVCV